MADLYGGHEPEIERHYREKMEADEEYYCESHDHPRIPDGDTCYCGSVDYTDTDTGGEG